MKAVVLVERLFTSLISCMENLIHGGIIFGWPSLVFVLIQQGYFSDLCSSSTSENTTTVIVPTTLPNSSDPQEGAGESGAQALSCNEQDAQLQLVFSVATAAQTICMFPVGFIFDRFGTRVSRLIMSFLLLAGYVLMGFNSPTYPYLIFPGTICFTVAGVILLLSSMQVGNLFKENKSTVITVINAMYGASVVVFLIVKTAYEAGFPPHFFFFILAGSVFFLNINTVIFLPAKHIPWPLPDDHRLVKCCRFDDKFQEKEKRSYDNRGFVGDTVDGEMGVSGIYKQNGHTGDGENNTDSQTEPEATPTQDQLPSRDSDDGILEERKRNEYSSLCSCVMSAPFWLILLWQMFLELDMIFTFGTLNYFLTRLAEGDDSLVSWYTDVFSITQIFVLIVGPLGGLLMDRNKLWRSCCSKNKNGSRGPYADMKDSCLPLAVTSLSSVGYSICLLIPSLQLQYLTFFFILILRSLLFGVGSAVVAIVFPAEHFASVYGAIRTISGFFSFLQYPIFILLQNYLDDDPFYVTIAFIVADVVTLSLPVSLYVMAKTKTPKSSKKPVSPVM